MGGKGTSGNLSKVMMFGASIAGISEHDVKAAAEKTDDSEYGDTNGKNQPTKITVGGSFKGKMRADDPGQAAIRQAFFSRTPIPDAKFYFGPDVYDTPDIESDPDACVFLYNFENTNTIKDMVGVNVSYEFYGKMKRVSV